MRVRPFLLSSCSSLVLVHVALFGGGCAPTPSGASTSIGDTPPEGATTAAPEATGASVTKAAEGRCAEGTLASGGGCTPNGNVLCADGTTFDAVTGTCVIGSSACPAGAVLVEGQCITPAVSRVVDLEEVPEPNDDLGAGTVALKEEGLSTVVHGCINPRDGQMDVDRWRIQVDEPTLLDITAEGVGGLVAGFRVEQVEPASNLQRLGLSMSSSTTRREVYLPHPGTYVLSVDDTRSVIAGGVLTGNPSACYFVAVRRVNLPTPQPLLPNMSGVVGGNVQRFSYTAGGDGQFLGVRIRASGNTLRPSFSVRSSTGFMSPAYTQANELTQLFFVGLLGGEQLDVIVDPVVLLTPGEAPFTLLTSAVASAPLPSDGASFALDGLSGEHSDMAPLDGTWRTLDVLPDHTLHINLATSVAAIVTIHPRVLTESVATFSSVDNSTPVRVDELVHFSEGGRYYVVVKRLDGTTNPATATSAFEDVR